MEMYNYYECVRQDVYNYVTEYLNYDIQLRTSGDIDAIISTLEDAVFVADAVTGNSSASYFCSAYLAEEALSHNLDLLAEACKEFDSIDIIARGAEACDVTIRCYLCRNYVADAVQSYFDNMK